MPAISGYEILGELGRGGMGVVYQRRPGASEPPLRPEDDPGRAHAGAEAVARFLAEAEAVARLQHPNIVQIYEIGEADGLPFFSLEYVPGGSLDRRLERQALAAAASGRADRTTGHAASPRRIGWASSIAT